LPKHLSEWQEQEGKDEFLHAVQRWVGSDGMPEKISIMISNHMTSRPLLTTVSGLSLPALMVYLPGA
jgi:hypothetical protein